MAQYVYSVASMRYGTPTGSNTMPASGTMTALPDTVKGSITIDETEGSVLRFYVDQKKEPVRSIKAEEGEFTLTAQFYDMTFAHLAAFKGGTAPTGTHGTTTPNKFVPSVGYTTVDKALRIVFDSGHVLNLFNASCTSRMTGGGGRDKMLAMEIKAVPQVSADLAGSYELTDELVP